MASESSGSSFSTSSSTPTIITTPENTILDQIAQYAQSLAPQMMDWANNVYGQTSQITNDAVNNFFNTSKQMQNFGSSLENQYNTEVAPQLSSLTQEANSYASPSRMKTDMGMAGATQAQAGNQAIKNSEQNLLSYGIDPSAGRYASLDKAAAVQNAANVAGAENQQRQQDINTGQQLRAEALQFGSQLPGAISNAENTAIQANAGASNATLANANTGANLQGLADKYLSTAMGLKLSPVSNATHGFGSSQNSSQSDNGGGGGGGGGGYSGSSGSDSSGPAWGMDMPTGNEGDPNVGGMQPDAGVTSTGWSPQTVDATGFGSGDYSDSSGGDTVGFATGGAIPDSMSPSNGAVTDDVPAQMPSGAPARLNANEFVIPRDVANWKGQEFFHKLIAQSRAARNQLQAASGAGPQRMPMQQQPMR